MSTNSIPPPPPPYTLDQLLQVKQVFDLFIPYAAQKEREYFPTRESRAQFVHYTSAEAALNIISSKRLWMRNTLCMSDYREMDYGCDILNRHFDSVVKPVLAAVDECVPNAGKEALDLFRRDFAKIRNSTYIASLSKHHEDENVHGRLSMWRAFGGTSPRVAIVWSLPWFTEVTQYLSLIFSPVAYFNENKVAALMQEVAVNIRDNGALLRSVDRRWVFGSAFAMLLVAVTCLKHEGFHEEDEWRIIHQPTRWPSRFVAHSTRALNGVPQLVYELPLDSDVSMSLAEVDIARILDRVIIGPTQYALPLAEALIEALTKARVQDAARKISISGIPIRT